MATSFAARILGPNAVAHFAGDSTRERQTEPEPDLSDLARFFPSGASNRERDLSLCFLRLANFDNGAFERVGRYEMGLWRQAMLVIFTLAAMKR